MNRRTKERVDLRLQCRLGSQKVPSAIAGDQTQIVGLTKNVSRCGLLLCWLDNAELPVVGADLTVDIDLPAEASFGPRMMRCKTTVVRIIRSGDSLPTVGMKIRNIRFVSPKQAGTAQMIAGQWQLESMPTASDRLN